MSQTLWAPTTQAEEVLAMLRDPYWSAGITAQDALTEVGTMRLAARIADLKAQGYAIESETVTVKARNGRMARVARYRLKEERTA